MEFCCDLSGTWQAELPGLGRFDITLPGTLDTNGIGLPDTPGLTSRLTRRHTWTGQAAFRRRVHLPEARGGRLFLLAERARRLELLADGTPVPPVHPVNLSTPSLFELTRWAGRDTELTIVSDNGYAGWPKADILRSSAATDETQTNWNGIIGRFGILHADRDLIECVRVYPQPGRRSLRVEIDVSLQSRRPCRAAVQSRAFRKGTLQSGIVQECGRQTVVLTGAAPDPDAALWDEGEGNLHALTACLQYADGSTAGVWQGQFGLRSFGVSRAARLTLNGRVFFLRGEANCAVFPQTGCPPMDKAAWRDILARYAAYGVNCMRFHSWCPPEAAFAAADELGMLMQPELSDWNCENAFATPEADAYYTAELCEILRCYGGHPSFVMLTLGNELQADDAGRARMNALLARAKAQDPTRLYANSSNWHYGEQGPDPASDFYTSMACRGQILRATSPNLEGCLNGEAPSARHDHAKAAAEPLAQGKPVFGFEVGQYENYPDFAQLEQYGGVTLPENLALVQRRVQAAGLAEQWPAMVRATGELALLCYREEAESVLRTPGMSGLSLLGLQDFPGQGTALVGMMDSCLGPKPAAYAAPERFRAFFRPVLPLVLLERYTYTAGETLHAAVKLANYGKTDVCGAAHWTLRQGNTVLRRGGFDSAVYRCQGLRRVGTLRCRLDALPAPARLELDIEVAGHCNTYPLWLYPAKEAPLPPVTLAETLTDGLLARIRAGEKVFLEPAPTEQALPGSVQGQFSTDFWSVGTFPQQSGCMGLLIRSGHPALAGFPTRDHAEWQWWHPAHGRGIPVPAGVQPIVTMLDSILTLRHLALLAEFRVGRGAVILSGMGLHQNQAAPENRALLGSILRYMASPAFAPAASLAPDELRALLGA